MEYRNRRPCGEDMPRKPLYRPALPTLPRQGNRSRPCCCFPAPSRQ
nr:MAG TPA: hypothetical protein [Inoviridae sp.]